MSSGNAWLPEPDQPQKKKWWSRLATPIKVGIAGAVVFALGTGAYVVASTRNSSGALGEDAATVVTPSLTDAGSPSRTAEPLPTAPPTTPSIAPTGTTAVPACTNGATKNCSCGQLTGTSECRNGNWQPCRCPLPRCGDHTLGLLHGRLTSCGPDHGSAKVYVEIDDAGTAHVTKRAVAPEMQASYDRCVQKLAEPPYASSPCRTDPDLTFQW